MSWKPAKNKPAVAGWYLVALPSHGVVLPCVTLAWYDGKWSDVLNFGNGERMAVPLYWQPMPALPPKLLAARRKAMAR